MSDFVHDPIPQVVVVHDDLTGGVKAVEQVNSDMDHRTEDQTHDALDLETRHIVQVAELKTKQRQERYEQNKEHQGALQNPELQKADQMALAGRQITPDFNPLHKAPEKLEGDMANNLDAVKFDPSDVNEYQKARDGVNDPLGPVAIVEGSDKTYTKPPTQEEIDRVSQYRASTPESEKTAVEDLLKKGQITEKRKDEWNKEIDKLAEKVPVPDEATVVTTDKSTKPEDQPQNVSPPPYSNINETQFQDKPKDDENVVKIDGGVAKEQADKNKKAADKGELPGQENYVKDPGNLGTPVGKKDVGDLNK